MERLLEREDELGMLEGVVRGLGADGGRLVLVGGEAGIGKTTLVRALRRRVEGTSTVVVGACEPLSVPVPLGPLRELAEAVGGADPAGLDTGDRLLLARRLMAALRARAPLVAVVEDAHWADPTTLDVIRLLARRVEEAPVAIVLTYRDDEVAGNVELGRLLGGLATSPAVRRIALAPLSREAVRELAGPAGVDPARLSRITGGNPFLVVEAIAAGGRLPSTVRDATLARAAGLGAAARAAVGAAAVIGQRVAPALLEQVEPGAAAAVEEALARGVMVADGPSLGFRHELIREAVESAIAPPRRAALHARVVAALAGRDDVDAARLAHHAELAGLADTACRYAALAAADAERLGALREATLQAERALRLGHRLVDRERLELLLLHSRAANFASTRLEDAVESATAAIELAVRLADRVREGRALGALAAALWSLDRVAEARDAAERAVAVLEPAGDPAALARAHATRVRMEATSFDPGEAVALGARALQVAARAGLEETRIDVVVSIALARGHRGDPGALTALADAARDARRAGLTIPTVRTYVNRVLLAATLRRHALCDALASEALGVFEEFQTTIPGFAVQIFRARSLLDRGRWDEARAVAARLGPEVGSEAAVALGMEWIVAARRGESGAAAALEAAWGLLRPVPESSRHGALRAWRVEAAWLVGDRPAALRLLEEARRSPAAARFARSAADIALWRARLGLAVPPPAGAPEPVSAELAGDWRGAIRAWRALEAPYEAALAALPGDDRAAREAVAALRSLGADGAVRAFARARGEWGAPAPRGPRRSTRANPAGLTLREQEVLERLADGATNPAIAAALHLSERTVAHHVSAILAKLGADGRHAAVARARERGLIAQHGTPGGQR